MTRRPLTLLSGFLAVTILWFLSAGASPGSATTTVDEELELCGACHEETVQGFKATSHGKLRSFELRGDAGPCTGCHGDGTAHMDAGGDPEQIRSLSPELEVDEVSDTCQSCHRSKALHDWNGSTHAMNDVGCTDCHKTHVSAREQKRDPQACYGCHLDVRSQFQYPSHHPLREGNMQCSSCHTPHGSSIGLVRNDEASSDLCLECHTQMQGPFIFEHEPVFEGCDTCHTPHGSIANNLLIQNEPFLCLQCHEMHFHSGLEGEPTARVTVPRYDPAQSAPVDGQVYPNGVPNPFREAGYKFAFTTKCTQCHTQVHGSDLPSQMVPGMGDALAR